MSPNVLFLTFVNPFVLSAGASLRTHYLLKVLSKLGTVTCIAIIPRDLRGKVRAASDPEICREYIEWDLLPPRPLSSFLRFKPTEQSSFFSGEYFREFKRILLHHEIDVILLDSIFFADYLNALDDETSAPRVIFDTDNIESDTFRDKSRLNRSPLLKLKYFLKWKLTRHLEQQLAHKARYLIAVSRQDQEYYSRLNPRISVFHLNSCIDVDSYKNSTVKTLAVPNRPALLYTGMMGYEATYEAALYFHREIMPILDRLLPTYTFYVVGKDPVQEVLDLRGPRVVVTGFVESTLPYFHSADVFVVPLLHGTGTRLKILEAMAAGLPIVTTPKGCEGLDVVDHEHVLIADAPEHFAHCVVELLEDAPLRNRLTAHARELVRTTYDWRSLEAPVRAMLDHVLAHIPSSRVA